MINQKLITLLTELEESVRVNKTAIVKILSTDGTGDGDKKELIKSITIPLIINNRSIISEIESIYIKGSI